MSFQWCDTYCVYTTVQTNIEWMSHSSWNKTLILSALFSATTGIDVKKEMTLDLSSAGAKRLRDGAKGRDMGLNLQNNIKIRSVRD